MLIGEFKGSLEMGIPQKRKFRLLFVFWRYNPAQIFDCRHSYHMYLQSLDVEGFVIRTFNELNIQQMTWNLLPTK